jgi:hypothetical protein
MCPLLRYLIYVAERISKINLQQNPTNKFRSWWKFLPAQVPPPVLDSSTSTATLSNISFSPSTASIPPPENCHLSGDYALKISHTGEYVKIAPSGQLEAGSMYLDASAVFTIEEKRGRCALQGTTVLG